MGCSVFCALRCEEPSALQFPDAVFTRGFSEPVIPLLQLRSARQLLPIVIAVHGLRFGAAASSPATSPFILGGHAPPRHARSHATPRFCSSSAPPTPSRRRRLPCASIVPPERRKHRCISELCLPPREAASSTAWSACAVTRPATRHVADARADERRVRRRAAIFQKRASEPAAAADRVARRIKKIAPCQLKASLAGVGRLCAEVELLTAFHGHRKAPRRASRTWRTHFHHLPIAAADSRCYRACGRYPRCSAARPAYRRRRRREFANRRSGAESRCLRGLGSHRGGGAVPARDAAAMLGRRLSRAFGAFSSAVWRRRSRSAPRIKSDLDPVCWRGGGASVSAIGAKLVVERNAPCASSSNGSFSRPVASSSPSAGVAKKNAFCGCWTAAPGESLISLFGPDFHAPLDDPPDAARRARLGHAGRLRSSRSRRGEQEGVPGWGAPGDFVSESADFQDFHTPRSRPLEGIRPARYACIRPLPVVPVQSTDLVGIRR